MSKTIISEGKTTTEAIEKGLKELKISKNQAEIKVLEEKKKSFFSILDPHIVKVEITVKENEKVNESETKQKTESKKQESCEKIEKKEVKREPVSTEVLEKGMQEINRFLGEFLKKISDGIEYKSKIDDEYIYVEILGEDSTKLIGYRGESLNALQVILSNIAGNMAEYPVKVIVDIENYREKRKKTLEELAVKIEKTVEKTGKKITLEPMSPYERKIIHSKLQDSDSVKTYSIGEDNSRRVVVIKK